VTREEHVAGIDWVGEMDLADAFAVDVEEPVQKHRPTIEPVAELDNDL